MTDSRMDAVVAENLAALKTQCGETAITVTNQMMDLVEAAFFAGLRAGLELRRVVA